MPIKIKNVHILKILLLPDLSYKNMHTSRQLFIYMNVHCSILCNIKTLGQKLVSINKEMIKLWFNYTMKYRAAIIMKKVNMSV